MKRCLPCEEYARGVEAGKRMGHEPALFKGIAIGMLLALLIALPWLL